MACEKRGQPAPPPIGLLFGSHDETCWGTITFAVAFSVPDRAHYNKVFLWAARDNSAGDSLGRDDICTSSGVSDGWPSAGEAPDPKHPTFKRAVQMVRKWTGKEPTVWDGKKAVPLWAYLKAHKMEFV